MSSWARRQKKNLFRYRQLKICCPSHFSRLKGECELERYWERAIIDYFEVNPYPHNSLGKENNRHRGRQLDSLQQGHKWRRVPSQLQIKNAAITPILYVSCSDNRHLFIRNDASSPISENLQPAELTDVQKDRQNTYNLILWRLLVCLDSLI
jgi:hypothetical protein